MTIIALIVTPLVMNIIRKARISADRRSVDAYGRSIELAIAAYLLDNGYFPTEVSQLTIEYSGNEVVCTIKQINNDSSVYLAGCTVAGRNVEYHYGENKESTPEPVIPSYTAYNVGDHVSYNGVIYYVIEDSNATNDTVKLLKEVLLLKSEIDGLNLPDVSCITNPDSLFGRVKYGESTDYSTSTVKQVVDAWKNTAVKANDTATARLITFEDLISNLGFEYIDNGSIQFYGNSEDTPNWIYNTGSAWWTMSTNSDSNNIWAIPKDGILYDDYELFVPVSIRPVLELNKSAEITKLAS